MTPAIAAGLSDYAWSIEELAGLLEEREAVPTGLVLRGDWWPPVSGDPSADVHCSTFKLNHDRPAANLARLKAAGVPFTMDATKEPGFGTVATFSDPDGNICQLMELE